MGETGQLEEGGTRLRAARRGFPRASEESISRAFLPTGAGYLQLTPAGAHFAAGAFKGFPRVREGASVLTAVPGRPRCGSFFLRRQL